VKIEIEIPDGYLLDGYTVKPVPVPLFTFAPFYIPPYTPPYVPNQPFISCGDTIDPTLLSNSAGI